MSKSSPSRKLVRKPHDVAWGYFYDNEYTKCRELCVYRVKARILLSRKMARLTKYRAGPIFKITGPKAIRELRAGKGRVRRKAVGGWLGTDIAVLEHPGYGTPPKTKKAKRNPTTQARGTSP